MAQLKFGRNGLLLETPAWATWTFRICTILTTALAFVVAGDPGITDFTKVRILLYLKGIDIVVLGLSKLFGIQPDSKDEPPKQQ